MQLIAHFTQRRTTLVLPYLGEEFICCLGNQPFDDEQASPWRRRVRAAYLVTISIGAFVLIVYLLS
jgi:hypothetical protein